MKKALVLLFCYVSLPLFAMRGVTIGGPSVGSASGSGTAAVGHGGTHSPHPAATSGQTPATFGELLDAQNERENSSEWTSQNGTMTRAQLLSIMNAVKLNAPTALRDYINMVLTYTSSAEEELGALLSMMSMDPAFFEALRDRYRPLTAQELYSDARLRQLIAREISHTNSSNYKTENYPILILEPTAGSLAVKPTCFAFKTTSSGTVPSVSKMTSVSQKSCEKQYLDLNELTLVSYYKRLLDPASLSQGDLSSAFSSVVAKKELNDRVMGYGLIYYWYNRAEGKEENPLFEGVERLKDVVSQEAYLNMEQFASNAGFYNAPAVNETFNQAVAERVTQAETTESNLNAYLNTLTGTNP